VGSTNLNLSSWMGNRELDVVVEDEAFGGLMEQMFREDLRGSTEIVLQGRSRVRPAEDVGPHPRRPRGAKGKRGRGPPRARCGIGNALGSVLAARAGSRPGGAPPDERGRPDPRRLRGRRAFVWPRLLAWPLAAIGLWLGLALLLRASRAVCSRSGAARFDFSFPRCSRT
jgi:cardiolipin synthase